MFFSPLSQHLLFVLNKLACYSLSWIICWKKDQQFCHTDIENQGKAVTQQLVVTDCVFWKKYLFIQVSFFFSDIYWKHALDSFKVAHDPYSVRMFFKSVRTAIVRGYHLGRLRSCAEDMREVLKSERGTQKQSFFESFVKFSPF